jgi:phage gpG-like protein
VSSNAAREVAEQLRAIRVKAVSDAPVAACRAMGETAQTAVKVTLTSSTHSRGTPTPSKPGQPPSLVSGNLRRSVHRTTARATAPGVAYCAIGAMAKYAPVHEFGPVTIRAKNFPQLGNPDVGFFGVQVTIPRRPFLAPTVERLVGSGMLTQVAVDGWQAVLDL